MRRLGADRRLGRQVCAGRFLDHRPDDGAGLGRAFGGAGALLVEDRLLADGDRCGRPRRVGGRARRRRGTGSGRLARGAAGARRCRLAGGAAAARGCGVCVRHGRARRGRPVPGSAGAASAGGRPALPAHGAAGGGWVSAATDVPSPTPAPPPAGPGSTSVPSGVRRWVNFVVSPGIGRSRVGGLRWGRVARPGPGCGLGSAGGRSATSVRVAPSSRRKRPCSARRHSRRRGCTGQHDGRGDQPAIAAPASRRRPHRPRCVVRRGFSSSSGADSSVEAVGDPARLQDPRCIGAASGF